MIRIILITTISFLVFHFTGQSQALVMDPYKILQERGEVYFKIARSGMSNMQALDKMISIDHKSDQNWIYVYANAKEFDEFRKTKIPFQLLAPPSTLLIPVMKDSKDIKSTDDWDFYPTYEAYVALMYQFQDAYPQICSVFSIGQTVEGRELLVARISDNAGYDEGEPQFLYTSSMHGDEISGYVLMLRLIDFLLSEYGNSDDITQMVDNMDIWINPLANPDGTYHTGNNTVFGATRYNANTVDLNRNYPDPEDGPHPDGQEYQPETEAFMNIAENNHFVMAANFHGGAEVFNYPWDTWPQLHADDDWWQFTGREWADTVHKYGPPGYFDDLNNGITNGYAWYTTSGSRQDYMNYFIHCREVTLEISNEKIYPAEQLPDLWEYNYRSFINYMKQASYGIRGKVLQKGTGIPLEATITLLNHDDEGSVVITNPVDGWFFRPVYEGVYSVSVMANNLVQTFDSVAVENYQSVQLDVLMHAGIQHDLDKNKFLISPNPFNDEFLIEYSGSEPAETDIRILSLSGKLIQEKKFHFNGEHASIMIDMASYGRSVYLLEIRDQNSVNTWKMIKR